MNKQITVTSPLSTELRVESIDFTAGLSQLGEMELRLLSESGDLSPEDLLGKPITVSISRDNDEQQHFNGYVTRFGIGRSRGRHFGYQAVVRPWPWFLTRTADCRIYQDLDVPAIVKQVFDDNGFSDFDFRLFRSYRKRTYCVQYRESDLTFITRLLEHEGIYWYFEHTASKHVMVLVDSSSAHEPITGEATLPYFENIDSAPPDLEYVSDWTMSREVRTGKSVLQSYDFERPSVDLMVDANLTRKHAQEAFERFDYQGDYIIKGDGKQLVDDRLDEHQARHHQLSAASNCHRLGVGHRFKLDRHPRTDQNAEFLVVGTTVHATIGGIESGHPDGDYRSTFTAMPVAQQFRPARTTRVPFVQGPQSAVVVGPSGDEIYTDKYGRVKVQFHWDRYGKNDDKSSCWVRVSHPWAGKSFGSIHIPRIGQEVIVSFLEGDPDQPLITGRVYNAEQMPPWDLPANATQTGILTRSSKGGAYDNANAIRFEDKKGAEEVWIHAEKDQRIEVENDESHWVGHDRKKTIDHDETTLVKHDRTETVGNNETITIGVNRTETVGSHEVIGIGINRTETVGANETITIGANRTISVLASETATVALQRTHAVGINETIAIGAAQEVAIGAMQSITVGINQSTSVGVNQSNSIGKNRTIEVGANQGTTVGKNRTASVGDNDTLTVGKDLVISAGDSITLKTGDAVITMKKDGTIFIKGKNITIDGSGKINVKASKDIVMKGSKILQN
ncbi:type VI secretion system Vgr family protein [Rhizobacter sp. Root1221]|uniref:type VI secretion system Vgr family protein n=1 Tax=Rhizobacter sp. Root1221 TaxID=1736433 RepID=UPI0006FBFDE3|nr:type VI secretion system tip protein TssI/VgrG [Rhizobacter sp. Root1221]KQV96826.1 type VI secretion protein ImpA [Rhizobacter sp. Root1221]